MNGNDLKVIQELIGYEFENKDLLQQAFVRRSYSKEQGGEDNEILELIGDSVLGVVIVKFLVEKYGFMCDECDDFNFKEDFNEFCCDYSEGKLTQIKSSLVGGKTLSEKIDTLGLSEYLIMGKGDIKNRVDKQNSVKEDLFEAIIGAVAIDTRWNFPRIQEVVEYMLMPDEILCKSKELNYVDEIFKWSRKMHDELPSLSVKKPDTCITLGTWADINFYPPKRSTGFQEWSQFQSFLTLPNINKRFIGRGYSKSEARKVVCKGAYEYLKDNELLFCMVDEIGAPKKDFAINQLETLARRGYFSIPTYNFSLSYDENGNPEWKCVCNIKEFEKKRVKKISSSKKDAKKAAAYAMLKYVLKRERM